MKIKSISVGGFRNIKKTKLYLDNITSIIAVNNYGKTNLLNAIKFGVDFINNSEEIRESMMSWKSGIPLNPKVMNDNYEFEIEFEDENLKDYEDIRYGYSFSWYKNDNSGCKILDEYIDVKSKDAIKYSSLLRRENGKYRKNKEVKSMASIKLDYNVLSVDILRHFRGEKISDVSKLIKGINILECDSLDTRPYYDEVPFEFGGGFSSVPKLIYNLKQKDFERYLDLTEYFYELFPDFEEIYVDSIKINPSIDMNINNENFKDIPFKILDEIQRVTIKSKYINQPISLDMMSAGTKRVIWLLTSMISAKYNNCSIIFIEEIETSIHPKLIKNLLKIISEISQKTGIKVLMTSHSPLAIQYLKPKSLYIGKSSDYGDATFSKLKKSKINPMNKIARARGLSLGELIFDILSDNLNSNNVMKLILENSNE